MKKVAKRRQLILCTVVMVALFLVTGDFTSLAAGEDSVVQGGEEECNVEVLEAIIVDGDDHASGVVPYTMLTDCAIGVSGGSDGMHIDISTGSVGTASVLGVKDVKIQKKTWYGGWNTVAVSSGGESYNCANMGINILYRNAEKGATYRILCVHYGDVNGYTEGENNSGEFVYSF